MPGRRWLVWMCPFALLGVLLVYNQYRMQQQLSYLKTENEVIDPIEAENSFSELGGIIKTEPDDPAVQEAEQVLYALENKEARAMAERLIVQNEKLKQEKLALQKQINRLSASLALARVENDDYKLRFTQENVGKSLPVAAAVNRTYQAEIVDVNADLDMVVLSLGSIQGMKPGMLFSIVRGDLVIGKVKVFDVRDRFSGALVIEKNQEGFVTGDRAIPWTERYGS